MSTITTRELLEAEARSTGIPVDQLLRIVAKSALIRHIASGKDADDFVLKGGTLLHHCYDGPRFSVIDADFTHRRRTNVTADELTAAMTLKEDDLAITFASDDWKLEDGIYQAQTGYTVGTLVIAGYRAMTVTVSVRIGEWMDPQKPLTYRDPLLAGQSEFKVNGLTLEELSAEKILAWCTKLLSKHAVDLALIARDHLGIDRRKAVVLAQRKFEIEGAMRRYTALGIRDFKDLRRVFLSDRAIVTLKREVTPHGLLLPGAELARPAEQSLGSAETVEHLLREVWLPLL